MRNYSRSETIASSIVDTENHLNIDLSNYAVGLKLNKAQLIKYERV